MLRRPAAQPPSRTRANISEQIPRPSVALWGQLWDRMQLEGGLRGENAAFPLDGASGGPAAAQHGLGVTWACGIRVCSNGAGAREVSGTATAPDEPTGTAAAIPGSS